MASEILTIHSKNPELRKIGKVVDSLKNGAVILYPTDTGFTLGCQLSNKNAINRIRQIRNIPQKKEMTFLCNSLSNIAEFAKVSNLAYKTIKRLIPGPYTFILPATREVPKFAQSEKRNTAGMRVPDHILSQLLLKELGEPIISISAKTEEDLSSYEPDEFVSKLAPLVDVAVRSDSYNFVGESTLLDMTSDDFLILRHGAGITKVLEFVEEEE
jgi:tRNA threonylcarbamoyl adenosine modification protein (Sua5/YciO/YrdC/YwlC family)